jgi:uncharacterized protein YdeI (YjbR/CyaY-like superfamily)
MKIKTNPKVDRFLSESKKWQVEIKQLRSILLDCGLTEEFKWDKPCYMFCETNLVIILPLKNTCGLLLCKGALLKDPHGILVKAGENTQAARQIRFTSLREIVAKQAILKTYIRAAIEAEKAGLEVKYKKPSEHKIPEEFKKRLDKNPALKSAFFGLTPGRQRGYLMFFSAPKQSKTRESRIVKCLPQILKGI